MTNLDDQDQQMKQEKILTCLPVISGTIPIPLPGSVMIIMTWWPDLEKNVLSTYRCSYNLVTYYWTEQFEKELNVHVCNWHQVACMNQRSSCCMTWSFRFPDEEFRNYGLRMRQWCIDGLMYNVFNICISDIHCLFLLM